MTHIAFVAASIAHHLEHEGDLAFICDDDQQSEALTAAVEAIAPGQVVVHLPSSDALPGDLAPASPANIGRRVAALRRLRAVQADQDRPRFACILSGEAAARRYPPPAAFDSAPPTLSIGQTLDVEAFRAQVEAIGYWPDDRVDEPGEVAVRGDVIDIYPADAGRPARVEIANGQIAALRAFDPANQRTVGELEQVEIGRAAEPDLSDITVPVLAHLGNAAIGMSDRAMKRRARFVALAADAPHAGSLCDAISEAEWSEELARHPGFDPGPPTDTLPRFVERRSPLAALAAFAKPRLAAGTKMVFAGSTRDLRFLRMRIERRLGTAPVEITTWTQAEALPPGSLAMLGMPVLNGFVGEHLILIAAGDLLGSRALLEDIAPASDARELSASAEIRIGDIVIHEDHGIGRVSGLEAMPGEQTGEAILLDYASGARRLVPVESADRLWRYGADADAVSLDRLDGSSWQKRRGQIMAAIAESARGLAILAAERARLSGPVIEPEPDLYERFASGFAFNETADQARAINAVRDDLSSGRPMDRLVVGDVGYGKTEVALRAAALAALAGYQVAFAAPTTVLVRQHLETFVRRFEGTGISVAGLSRLSSPAQRKQVKAGLADGSLGIVIGTGAIMAKDVRYAKLGLVVIDEEQRFGAADKARLRGNGEVHMLTLSATPIPRTLQMALIGLQHVSVIATPPARRQPIRTSLDGFNEARIRTALMREKGRGGQSFVVVPRIQDMAPIAERLRKAAPELSIVEAHGKLPTAEIDAAMVGFADGGGDVLLATNIIEAGLDVPRANTMIVWRADRFGLAQLHQLRGRVGRGNRRGQVILLTDDEASIAPRTLKRLRTLSAFDRLGAGFEISAQDLDMRGAGDLLGENQAGHIKLIGIDLYQMLLESALREARGETVQRWTPDLRLEITGSLPDSWIPEADTRLSLYVRLARATDGEALDAFEEELIDRFGPLPSAAASLLAGARIGVLARASGIARIDAGRAAIALTPRPDFQGEADHTGLVEKDGRWLLREETNAATRLNRVQALLEALID